MEGGFRHWPETVTYLDLDPYGKINDHDPYVDANDVQLDMPCSLLSTDSTDTTGFFQPMSPSSLLAPVDHFGFQTYAEDAVYPMGKTSVGQHLSIDTQFSLNQIRVDDSGSSTASSSSFSQLLSTPYLQPWNFQPSAHVSPPQSASSDGGRFMPMTPLSVSPSLPFGVKTFDNPSLLPMEPEVETQSPMAHIIEWKRVIELCRTNDFVPQTVYQPYTEADKKRYIRDVSLQQTIVFHSHGACEWGIYLDDALKQKLRNLKDKDNHMFIGCGPSVSIRIQWPGYPPWSKQIPTMDFKTPKRPITRAKLAKNIAACVRRFLAYMQNKPMEAESDRRWRIGNQHIKVEDLILVSLHHVSKGSWQPQLRFRPRPPHPNPPHQNELLPPAAVS